MRLIQNTRAKTGWKEIAANVIGKVFHPRVPAMYFSNSPSQGSLGQSLYQTDQYQITKA